MKCGHLFNGIGGFALAAHWMGWENLMHCEIDPFCNQVMNCHFPNSIQHEDIRTTDFAIWRGKLDVITGGFPCQPYSTAGKRKGKNDDRHLWPEMLRAIRQIRPGWVVGENVRGLTNWNGGLVFDEVQADLESEGYEVIPFILPAAGVGAPHRRDRIWFIAHSVSHGYERENRSKENRCQEETIEGTQQREKRNELQREWVRANAGGDDAERFVADPNYINGWSRARWENRKEIDFFRSTWQDFPTQSPICGRDAGLSFGLVDITFSKWRRESLKSLGNAIVPQVAYQLFTAIEQYELL